MNLIDLGNFIENAAGIPVIAANQSIERPERPYATFNIISQVRDGQREVRYVESGTDLEETLGMPYVYNVEVQIYTTTDRAANGGKLARERLNDFLLYLNSDRAVEETAQLDFSILRHTAYENADEYLSTEFERRAIAEIQVYGYETMTTQVNKINPDQSADFITINLA